MDLPIPVAKTTLKIRVDAALRAELERIAERHYNEHREAFEAAGEGQPTAEQIAAIYLNEAIRREAKPARSNSSKTARRGSESLGG